MVGENGDNGLVDAIVALGRGLSLPVTAEGVETAGILDALKKIGPLKGQGYLYGRPEDAGATQQRLAKLSLLASSEPAVEPQMPVPVRKAG
jgi:EAL domain-containing protein (putative c-di-GMP-specific phosphodiesterase class I)